MKNILKYLMFFILLNVLSGCTGIGSSKIMLDEKNQALPSSIGAILSDFSFASLGTGAVSYTHLDVYKRQGYSEMVKHFCDIHTEKNH